MNKNTEKNADNDEESYPHQGFNAAYLQRKENVNHDDRKG
jgi:hypothetical protein